METTKKVSDVDRRDLQVLERVFGQSLQHAADSLLVLRVTQGAKSEKPDNELDDVPAWCNVFEGLSDVDLAEVNEAVTRPVRLGSCAE